MYNRPPAKRSRRRSLAIYAIAAIGAYVIPGTLSAFGSDRMIGLSMAIWAVLTGPGIGIALLAHPVLGPMAPDAYSSGLALVPLTLLPVYFYASAATRKGRVVAGVVQAVMLAVGLVASFVLFATTTQ